MLRAHHCVRCGDPMPLGRRVDRKYCRASCRTSAYRERRREAAPRRMRRERPRSGGQPLPPDLVLALRQIPPAILAALAQWFSEHASAEQLTAARQRIAELEQQVHRLRAEHAHAVQREEHRREQQRQRDEESAQQARDQHAREAEERQRTEAATKQIVELKDALWKLEVESTERTEALKRERAEHAHTEQAAAQEATEQSRQLHRVLSERDQAKAEALGLRKQLYAEQARCEELQAQVTAAQREGRERKQEPKRTPSEGRRAASTTRQEAQRFRSPPAEPSEPAASGRKRQPSAATDDEDELLPLMMDYVVLREDLAYKARQRGVDTGWSFLPNRSREMVAARAMALAVQFRRHFYNRPGRPAALQPRWIVYDHKMDDASEAMLQAELRLELEKLREKLARTR